ncbi:MAG: hypothetical protein ACM3JH_16550, partial [Acidithiobacillales bacterium]
ELYRRMIQRAEVKKAVEDPDLLEMVEEMRRAEARPAAAPAPSPGRRVRWEGPAGIEEPGYGFGV